MSHVAILCPPTPGHLYPMTTLGRALKKRGHRVTVLQLPELREQIEREGLELLPLGEELSETAELATAIEQLSRLSGLQALRFTIQSASKLAKLVLRDAPRLLLSGGFDIALIDQNEPAGGSAAERAGIPFINIAHLPLNREAAIPPPFVPWDYSDTFLARGRNRAGYAIADRLMRPLTSVLNEQRRQWGLSPLRSPDDSFSAKAQLCTLPQVFDFPRRKLPDCFRYVGPFLDEGRGNVPFACEILDGRPLVYASFGTLQNGQEAAFETVAAACEGIGVQLIMSTGGGDLPVRRWPGGAIVVRYAAQLELLKRSRIFITHAGLNSVLESLHAGVPMVAIPITNDQPAVAARLKRSGAAEVVPINRLTRKRLRAAIERVLSDHSYRQKAAHLQQEICNSSGVKGAADIVESLLKTATLPCQN